MLWDNTDFADSNNRREREDETKERKREQHLNRMLKSEGHFSFQNDGAINTHFHSFLNYKAVEFIMKCI